MIAGGMTGFDVWASTCSAVLIATGKSAIGWRRLTSFARARVLSTSGSRPCFQFIAPSPCVTIVYDQATAAEEPRTRPASSSLVRIVSSINERA